jgi:hypothetical protein
MSVTNGNKKKNGNRNGPGRTKQQKDDARDVGLATTVVIGMLFAPLPTLAIVGSAYLAAKRREKRQQKST